MLSAPQSGICMYIYITYAIARTAGHGRVRDYTQRMLRGSWGGGIEMAAFSHMKGMCVHVYERRGRSFQRISCFNAPGDRARARTRRCKTAHVLYSGRVHFDSLIL